VNERRQRKNHQGGNHNNGNSDDDERRQQPIDSEPLYPTSEGIEQIGKHHAGDERQ
jgi:hypothetical protein